MIYLGIDIANSTILPPRFLPTAILIEPFKFTNNCDGFYLLLSYLAPLDQNSIITGLESTAHYSDNLVRFLLSKDFKVRVLNPVKTSALRKNNVRRTKTDKVGTFLIDCNLKGSGLHRTQRTRQVPSKDCEAAYPFKNTAHFLH
ncbi:MAG: transposase [Eubacteriales bacterium]|nr:transposase [Eubacteriales bacterium]